MAQIFGNFIEKKKGSGEHLRIDFSPTSLPIQQRWRNYGLSADFLADYLSTFFPGEDGSHSEKQAEIKDAISYIANELLENAMKFSYAPAQHAVSIDMYLEVDAISLFVTNSVDPQTVDAFEHLIERLLSEDVDDLYMDQLMHNAESESDDTSGMGYLTMLHDYEATLAWKFATIAQEADVVTVTTMAQLSV
jgi:hypothetical protein